ncbi:SpnB-like Rossmann fold domain-containing protein, partial [Streptomyces marinisediminis]|uniref:SpnB-like Rossmann fold domain-containing protein n=1 Tax=Streptomyces marinisediminis TaxID=2984864 RepID=UPI003853E8A1|nr:hypothetical protein [Streptomyces sp. JHD 1]
VGAGGLLASDAGVRLPFAWDGVELHAAGARSLRVRLAPAGADAVTVAAVDAAGAPVASVASLAFRPAGEGGVPSALRRAADASLFRLEWVPGTEPADGQDPAAVTVAVCADPAELDAADAAAEAVVLPCRAEPGEDVRAVLARVLAFVQAWLADGRRAASRLAVVTSGALDGDPVCGAVWGLLRSAQTENPGRVLALDVDAPVTDADLPALVRRALALGEPQVAVRGGKVFVARLVRAGGGLAVPSVGGGWSLGSTGKGTLENLALLPAPDAAGGGAG